MTDICAKIGLNNSVLLFNFPPPVGPLRSVGHCCVHRHGPMHDDTVFCDKLRRAYRSCCNSQQVSGIHSGITQNVRSIICVSRSQKGRKIKSTQCELNDTCADTHLYRPVPCFFPRSCATDLYVLSYPYSNSATSRPPQYALPLTLQPLSSS